MKIGIYARVSTKDQDNQNQIIKLKEYAKIREWKVIEVYQDVVTGRKFERPALNELKKDIKKGKIKGVLVWSIDRLGRSAGDMINLAEFFKDHNVSLIIFGSNIDTTSPMGKMVYSVFSALAELERSQISERTKLAYNAKKARANNLGQKVNWGRKPKQVDQIIKDYLADPKNEGKSYGEIAKDLNLAKSLVYRRIKTFQNG